MIVLPAQLGGIENEYLKSAPDHCIDCVFIVQDSLCGPTHTLALREASPLSSVKSQVRVTCVLIAGFELDVVTPDWYWGGLLQIWVSAGLFVVVPQWFESVQVLIWVPPEQEDHIVHVHDSWQTAESQFPVTVLHVVPTGQQVYPMDSTVVFCVEQR